jgi:hypothetical protein
LPRLYRYIGIITPPVSGLFTVGAGVCTREGEGFGFSREDGWSGCAGVLVGRDVFMTSDGVADGNLVGRWGNARNDGDWVGSFLPVTLGRWDEARLDGDGVGSLLPATLGRCDEARFDGDGVGSLLRATLGRWDEALV